ncbi:universal stress protein [Chrysiogenes arsenatis]|uniref:universal stress protein n=1 Tax=Chrysiogenes arsenatis TaxID=309797 RepID=UPI0004124CA7|nr:universal stress protein [Chrysiogenes arsenatis]
MIPKIEKILYATDLSANAHYAFGYALSMALAHNAKISIINVYEKLTSNRNIEMRSVDFQTAKTLLTDKIKERLQIYREKENIEECLYEKLIENIYVAAGSPVDEVVKQAKAGAFDLIVAGTHGHGFLYSTLMGSTAKKIVQQSEIPVLVVRIPDKRQ